MSSCYICRPMPQPFVICDDCRVRHLGTAPVSTIAPTAPAAAQATEKAVPWWRETRYSSSEGVWNEELTKKLFAEIKGKRIRGTGYMSGTVYEGTAYRYDSIGMIQMNADGVGFKTVRAESIELI